jgi:chemotaxis regulatin CheY-phosphate phosphatase CheZ
MGIVRSVHLSLREFIDVTGLLIKNVLSFIVFVSSSLLHVSLLIVNTVTILPRAS